MAYIIPGAELLPLLPTPNSSVEDHTCNGDGVWKWGLWVIRLSEVISRISALMRKGTKGLLS